VSPLLYLLLFVRIHLPNPFIYCLFRSPSPLLSLPFTVAGTQQKVVYYGSDGIACAPRPSTTGGSSGKTNAASAANNTKGANRRASIRLGHTIGELFKEQQSQGVPTVVMSKRDLTKSHRDQLLLKSNKLYLKQPMQAKLDKMTKVQTKMTQRQNEVNSGQHQHPSHMLTKPEWGDTDILPVPHRAVKQYTPRGDVASQDLFRELRKPASPEVLNSLAF
jgi:hypothetical protein